MNRALPSGAAKAELLNRSKAINTANALREQVRNSCIIDSDTSVILKINFPLYKKRWQNYNTNPKSKTHFSKNLSQYWRGFQPIFANNKFSNVIFLSAKMGVKIVLICCQDCNHFPLVKRNLITGTRYPPAYMAANPLC